MLSFKWTPWWGTLPDYIAAVGTVGAFFGGIRLLRKELEARRDDVEDRRAAQARLVAAWVGPSHPEVDPDKSNPRTVSYILTRNGSSEPVANVWVTTRWKADRVNFSKSDRPARRPRHDINRLSAYAVIAPDTTETERREAEKSPIPDEVEIEFTDSAGHRWIRHPNGRLQLLSAPQPTRRRSVKDRLEAFTKGQLDALDT
jgi:hypothetical protein